MFQTKIGDIKVKMSKLLPTIKQKVSVQTKKKKQTRGQGRQVQNTCSAMRTLPTLPEMRYDFGYMVGGYRS